MTMKKELIWRYPPLYYHNKKDLYFEYIKSLSSDEFDKFVEEFKKYWYVDERFFDGMKKDISESNPLVHNNIMKGMISLAIGMFSYKIQPHHIDDMIDEFWSKVNWRINFHYRVQLAKFPRPTARFGDFWIIDLKLQYL